MQEYQLRVIREHEELIGKVNRLEMFLSNTGDVKLSDIDRGLLKKQLKYMHQYAHVLALRISRFFQQSTIPQPPSKS